MRRIEALASFHRLFVPVDKHATPAMVNCQVGGIRLTSIATSNLNKKSSLGRAKHSKNVKEDAVFSILGVTPKLYV
jgi:hypothetical protein